MAGTDSTIIIRDTERGEYLRYAERVAEALGGLQIYGTADLLSDVLEWLYAAGRQPLAS
jgi:hypothetical protein